MRVQGQEGSLEYKRFGHIYRQRIKEKLKDTKDRRKEVADRPWSFS